MATDKDPARLSHILLAGINSKGAETFLQYLQNLLGLESTSILLCL